MCHVADDTLSMWQKFVIHGTGEMYRGFQLWLYYCFSPKIHQVCIYDTLNLNVYMLYVLHDSCVVI